MSTKKVILFPGQGAQMIGMGKALFPKYRSHIEEAKNVLGYDIESVCLNGPSDKLNKTLYTQPALYLVSCLSYLEFIEQGGHFSAAVGHSVGEYAALFALGVFDFVSGLRLLQRRATLMDEAMGGAMLAVLDMKEAELNEVNEQDWYGEIDIANINSPKQIVFSGPEVAIGKLNCYINEHLNARSIPLRVSGAFHSRYMRPAAEEFNNILKTINFETPKAEWLSNVSGKFYSDEDIAKLLRKQLYSPVHWYSVIKNLDEAGYNDFIELGESNVLRKLISDCREPLSTDSKFIEKIQSRAVPDLDAIKDSKVTPVTKASFPEVNEIPFGTVCSALIKDRRTSFAVNSLMEETSLLSTCNTPLPKLIADVEKASKFGKPLGVSIVWSYLSQRIEDSLFKYLSTISLPVVELAYIPYPSRNFLNYRAKMQNYDTKFILRTNSLEAIKNFIVPDRHKYFIGVIESLSLSPETKEELINKPLIDAVSIDCVNLLCPTEESVSIFKETKKLIEQTGKEILLGFAGEIKNEEDNVETFNCDIDFSEINCSSGVNYKPVFEFN